MPDVRSTDARAPGVRVAVAIGTASRRPAIAPRVATRLTLLAAVCAAAPGAAGDGPRAEPSPLPPTVFADGTGLPAGAGTAREGAAIYAERCAGCHGSSGEGGRAIELVGDRALLASDAPDRGIAVHWPYAPPLYDYVRRAMPPEAPYSLGPSETYAVVARLLELNGLVDADTSVDARWLSSLRMPNVEGFERAPD